MPVRPKDAVEWRSAWVGPDVARNRESIMKGFARQARAFARSPLQRDPERLGRLLAFAAPRPDEAALDVACGPGIVTAALARRAGLVVGVDLAREMIDEARGAGGLYLRADVERLPFKDGSFDLVICRNACHHFADPPVVAREMRRVARLGGRVVIEDMAAPEDPARREYHETIERLRDTAHARTLTRPEIRALLEAAGLRVEREEPIAFVVDFEEWADRAFPPPADKEKARAMLLACLEEDRAGLRVWREGERLKFERQSVLCRATRPV